MLPNVHFAREACVLREHRAGAGRTLEFDVRCKCNETTIKFMESMFVAHFKLDSNSDNKLQC